LDLFSQPQLLAQQVWYLVPGLVLVASLLGSTHCVAMCGGIVMALPAQKSAQLAYHLGRLSGYLLLGALAGSAGGFLLQQSGWLNRVATVMMALLLFALALQVWRGRSVHLSLPPGLNQLFQGSMGRALQASRKRPWLGSLAVGWLSMFLPCGWLYTFVLGALLTGSFWLGALYLIAFWVGTVPFLALGPALLSQWFKRSSERQRQWVASLFVLAGLLTLSGFWGRSLPIDASHLADPSQPLRHQHGAHSSSSEKEETAKEHTHHIH